MVSVEHQRAPPVKGNVRAHTFISGYIVSSDPERPGSSLIKVISQLDIKGLVPKIIVNTVAAKGPTQWVTSLIKNVPMIKDLGLMPDENEWLGKINGSNKV